MTHMRYWAMTLVAAVAGAFIVVSRFAFASSNANWIIFGVAIGATVMSAGAAAVALLRDNQAFSGTSGLAALVGAFTIIATRVFTGPSALWLAFAGGSALLLLSLRALALHETTIERVVHQLEVHASGRSTVASRRGAIEISGTMRSWLYWLSHTGIALAGGFVVVATFVWPRATAQVSPQWLAFGVGVAAATVAFAALADRALDARTRGLSPDRLAAVALSGAALLVAGALIAVMAAATNPYDLRWWAFGLAAGLVGVSLVALIVHELTSERVRHELEVARDTSDELVAVAIESVSLTTHSI
jgi:hypothetical protein